MTMLTTKPRLTLTPCGHAGGRGHDITHSVPPEMSEQERAWWSNPYLRMLASPMRQCSLTGRYLPKDFLVRLARFKIPEPLHKRGKVPPFVIFPDGLQHHTFKARKSGRGMYLICARQWLDLFLSPRYKRFGVAPPRLAEQISHILRLRVLQELLLIAKRVQSLYRGRSGPAPALLRRLTRAELAQLRTTGVIPHPGALAVIICPPVNRDPTTKERPSVQGSMTDAPLEDAQPATPKRATPPLSVLHPTSLRLNEDELDVEPHVKEQIPLYNGVALFPGRVQRARLHELLTKILRVEGAWRFTTHTRLEQVQGSKKGEHKASHAFLVCPSEEVDMAPLAVALWRVRMWEGQSQQVDCPPWVEEKRRMQF
ncbi:hypothetical protein FB45DRAFT_407592 [Roridomyces roridus]|uniref:Uncharacterized protein n=1 Tax=Roridomyces roridus TaxID=1738132 RepID=A0AAD7C414_9AGAR|nr:hypothetical protein FB45DRAFT_407592 [Roridomyces roridus]